MRADYQFTQRAPGEDGEALARYRELAVKAVAAQRATLGKARSTYRINVYEYNCIDWRELVVLPDEGRHIEGIGRERVA